MNWTVFWSVVFSRTGYFHTPRFTSHSALDHSRTRSGENTLGIGFWHWPRCLCMWAKISFLIVDLFPALTSCFYVDCGRVSHLRTCQASLHRIRGLLSSAPRFYLPGWASWGHVLCCGAELQVPGKQVTTERIFEVLSDRFSAQTNKFFSFKSVIKP